MCVIRTKDRVILAPGKGEGLLLGRAGMRRGGSREPTQAFSERHEEPKQLLMGVRPLHVQIADKAILDEPFH